MQTMTRRVEAMTVAELIEEDCRISDDLESTRAASFPDKAREFIGRRKEVRAELNRRHEMSK